MLKSYKTEINPTPEQATKIRQTIGVCRFVYNFYLAENKAEYEHTGGFLSAFTFSKWLNNEYLPSHDDKAWIRDVKCARLGIELRVVDRFYPSSKTCHHCGNHKADLTLRDRTYVCEACGYSEDRDLNAALNLRDATVYKIA